MTDRHPSGRARRGRGSYVLLAVPLIGVLIPTIYNTSEPALIGIPFFYWYQMLWVPLSVLCTIVVYRATRRSAER
ncbi:MAG: DUF3311 domain-containing protein [Solirubrobacteraceae bacterium]